jgi:uncharacterized protein YkwD
VNSRRLMAAVPMVALPLAAPAAAPAASPHDRLERAVVQHINAERARYHLPPLRSSPRLARVASRHSADQLRHGRLSHATGRGTPFAVRLARVTRARKVGETIAWMSRSRQVGAARFVRLWLSSPRHRAQLLDPSFRRVGVGRRRGRMGTTRGTIVTADFATRR